MVLDAPSLEISPSRILILDTAWVGDVVFTTSLIGAVKRTWPMAQIHVLIAPRGEAVVRNHPYVNRLWVYDKHGREKSFRNLQRLGRELNQPQFDLLLNAHPSARSRLLTRLIGAKVSVGYAGFGSRFCFTHVIPNDLAVEPDHVQRRINLLRAVDVDAKPEPLMIGLDPFAVKWRDDFLRETVTDSAPVLGLISGAAWKTKQWTETGFAELGKRWHAETGGSVMLIGGPAEGDRIACIASALGPSAIPVIDVPLSRVAALLARCQAAVGGDTGVSFLAIAAGCPRVLVLYGSTQVNYSFPEPHKAITAGVPCCLPRTGHGAHLCRWGEEPWCMHQITTERLWGELQKHDDTRKSEMPKTKLPP